MKGILSPSNLQYWAQKLKTISPSNALIIVITIDRRTESPHVPCCQVAALTDRAALYSTHAVAVQWRHLRHRRNSTGWRLLLSRQGMRYLHHLRRARLLVEARGGRKAHAGGAGKGKARSFCRTTPASSLNSRSLHNHEYQVSAAGI
jgi:hypothetical protein